MNCPWCDAKPNERPYANPNEWECSSFTRGERRYQTDACRVRQADKKINELRQQRDDAVTLLREYGQHKGSCKYLDSLHRPLPPTGHRVPCSCGLAAAIARVKGEQGT